MLYDLRYAIRGLVRTPGFTAAAVLTLALGIGANSAIFALVDAALLRPLPFTEADRLVMLWDTSERSPRGRVAPANLLDWDERNTTFTGMAGFRPNVGGMVMSGADGTAETVPRQWVTAELFDVLGIKPVAGRTFLPSDAADRRDAVVLSESFWRARFNADPAVVGSDLRLDGQPYTVVGVVPKEFQLLGRTSMWALLYFDRRPDFRSGGSLQVVGRLKPGVTVAAAGADMAAVAEGLARELPDTNKGRGVAVEPLHAALIGGDLRRTSMLFLGVVAFVLLVCCANVANLLLARATVRARELAVRSALGASRRRLVRQLLTESLVLSAVGGALGLALGKVILDVAPSIVPEGLLPGAVTLALDGRVVAFCAGAALLVGVLFGLVPAWQATEFSSARVITSESRTVTGRGGRIRGLLVVGEVATAVLLLFGAGLLLRTLLAVENVDRGYRADQVLTMLVDPIGSRYPTEAALLQFYDAVAQEALAVPGVHSVAWASTLPLGPSYAGRTSFEVEGEPPVDPARRPMADYQIVSASYFQAVDLPLLAGRAFDDRDTRAGALVCIVNEAFVRVHLQGRSPLGRRVSLPTGPAPEAPRALREIVGVARQVKGRPDETEDFVQMYVPLAQEPIGDIFLVVRAASGPAESLATSVRGAIARVDKEQLVGVRGVMTLEDVAWEATARHRFRAVMVATFAGLALVLAMVGVFGLLAYSVQQRMRDFGVRRALGASTGDVLRQVVGSGARMIATGAAIGLVLSALLGRLVASMLFGVEPLDLLTFGSVILVLAVTAAVSTAGPAWRAARVDPAVALRSE